MFKLKKKNKEDKNEVKETKYEIPEEEKTLDKGIPTLKELLATPVDRSNENYLQVGEKYVKNLYLKSYPSTVQVGWIDRIYNYNGDNDTTIYIEPADEREAIESLSKKITQFEAQLIVETEKGSNRNITSLQKKIDDAIRLRSQLEQNSEKLFYTKLFTNIYCDSVDELNKNSQIMQNYMKARNAELKPTFFEQDKGYLSCLPYGTAFTKDPYRNFSAGALTASFPFYNAEISHPNGIFLGVNLPANTPVFLDPFSRLDGMTNSNISVFGMSGSGKTFLTSLITMRLALNGVTTVIVDPEGEYKTITKNLGGTIIEFGPASNTVINPFDIETEEGEHGEELNLSDKVVTITNLIGVMSKGMDREQESLISIAVLELYESFGISNDPSSLYEQTENYDIRRDEYYYIGKKKTMPTLSDFYRLLEEKVKDPDNAILVPILNSLKMFKKGEVYGLFDGQTNVDINFKDLPIITFDISSLEEGTLRQIGMYQSLTWIWEAFVKKNPEIRKMVLVDEAWMMVSSAIPGSEYTAAFLDKAARRIRKRNAGLIVASQSFNEFKESALGRSVLTNTALNILLKQKKVDIKAVQEVFSLSDGESSELLSANLGEALIKLNESSAKIRTLAFQQEYDMIVPKHLKR